VKEIDSRAALLSKNQSELSDEYRKQTDKLLQQTLTQTKDLRLQKALALIGIMIEATLVIRMFL